MRTVIAALSLALPVSGLLAQAPAIKAADPQTKSAVPTQKVEAPKPPPPPAYADPAATDADFPLQGEFTGEANGKKLGVQVIALGDGEFQAVGYGTGLPGAGWDGNKDKVSRTTAKREADKNLVIFKNQKMIGALDGTKIAVTDLEGNPITELKRVERRSPTLEAPAPAGAVVLFDGKGINRFAKDRVTKDGLLMEGVTSEDKFTDFTLHIEFRLPYIPKGRGQGRGNSGIYLQGRYEIQMLDSFGLEGKDNECGGIYKISAPKINLCYPPLTWQTYDIDFTAAKFDATGNKAANARVTVKHNGETIQDNLELPNVTGGASLKTETTAPGPINLQNHSNPVRYRNIWVLPK